MELHEYATRIIKERRSVYTNQFTGARVDDTVIEEMLECARWAPTHKMTQPWRFCVFSGTGLERLAGFQASTYREKALAAGNYDESKYEKLLSKPLECSHVIAIGMHRNPVVPEVEEVCAVACAVQNMWLLASAHRVGCYWSTGGITFYEKVGDFFGWDKNDALLGFLFTGTPRESFWPAGRRDELDVLWVRD